MSVFASVKPVVATRVDLQGMLDLIDKEIDLCRAIAFYELARRDEWDARDQEAVVRYVYQIQGLMSLRQKIAGWID